MLKFRDMELDFDLFDADTADDYEAAVEQVRETAVKVEGERLGDAIRRQCNAVFVFFDDLFGEDFHKELFGDKTNLTDCVLAFQDFVKAVDEQKKELDTLVAGSAPASTPNRAARRAANRAAKG